MFFLNPKRQQQFENTPLMGIDYGTQVVGLATFCPGREPFPLPYGRLLYENDEQILQELKPIIANEGIEVAIIGLPLHSDGSPSEMSKRVKKFGETLQKNLPPNKNGPFPVYYQDETLTSYEAEERMKNSSRYNFRISPKEIDALAASIILEDFMKNG